MKKEDWKKMFDNIFIEALSGFFLLAAAAIIALVIYNNEILISLIGESDGVFLALFFIILFLVISAFIKYFMIKKIKKSG